MCGPTATSPSMYTPPMRSTSMYLACHVPKVRRISEEDLTEI